jgi:hypothetical protein
MKNTHCNKFSAIGKNPCTLNKKDVPLHASIYLKGI